MTIADRASMLTMIAVTRSGEGVNGDGGLWFASGNVRFAGGAAMAAVQARDLMGEV